jgi:error-prone DNA polymerase
MAEGLSPSTSRRADAENAALLQRSPHLRRPRWQALTIRRRPGDAVRLHALDAQAARRAACRSVATGDILYHSPDRRMLQDVVTAIREKCTIDELGFRRERHADRHLKGPDEMERRFAAYPDAVAASAEIARRCTFDLRELATNIPTRRDPRPDPQQALEKLTWDAAHEKYPDGVPERPTAQLRHELKLIGQLGYAPYFLTVNSIVQASPAPGHPLPGPRLGGEQLRLLPARHHLDRSHPARTAVRALRLPERKRAARHRRRFRA